MRTVSGIALAALLLPVGVPAEGRPANLQELENRVQVLETLVAGLVGLTPEKQAGAAATPMQATQTVDGMRLELIGCSSSPRCRVAVTNPSKNRRSDFGICTSGSAIKLIDRSQLEALAIVFPIPARGGPCREFEIEAGEEIVFKMNFDAYGSGKPPSELRLQTTAGPLRFNPVPLLKAE